MRIIYEKYYHVRCNLCNGRFDIIKLKKLIFQSLRDDLPFKLEMNIENVVQNMYQEKSKISKYEGSLVGSVKDIQLSLTYPHCHNSDKYPLKNLVITDRLD